MQIHLHHNGDNVGVFSVQQVKAMLRSGIISNETLAWTEGLRDWSPLNEIIGSGVHPLPDKSSYELHPFIAYSVQIGRIGRRMWILRMFANTVTVFFLALP